MNSTPPNPPHDGTPQGDRASRADWVGRHAKSIWPLCLRAARGRIHEAEDLAQETLVRALHGLGGFDSDRNLEPWLRGIATRVIADHFRRAHSKPSPDGFDPGEYPAPDQDELDGPESPAILLASALQGCDPVTQQVLSLRYADGLTRVEIGELLGLSTEAVKKRIHRGRANMLRRLGHGKVIPR